MPRHQNQSVRNSYGQNSNFALSWVLWYNSSTEFCKNGDGLFPPPQITGRSLLAALALMEWVLSAHDGTLSEKTVLTKRKYFLESLKILSQDFFRTHYNCNSELFTKTRFSERNTYYSISILFAHRSRCLSDETYQL